MKKTTRLPRETMRAVIDYAAWAGPGWKARLLADWQRAGSDWRGSYHVLHQLRNAQWGGPKWLSGFELPVRPARMTTAEIDSALNDLGYTFSG